LFIALMLVGIAALAAALFDSPDPKDAPASLMLQYVAYDVKGAPMALMELTLDRKVSVHPGGVEVKAGDRWQAIRTVPTNILNEAAHFTRVAFQTGEGGRRAGWVHFPTNQTWRLQLQIVEPRKGIGGVVERLVYARSFYRIGGFKNVVEGRKPVPGLGRRWRVVSDEVPPLP
jgi:hypothetical protein